MDQKEIYKKFKDFEYPKIAPIVSGCVNKTSSKLELTPSQKFISAFFKPQNENGMLLYHSIGSGKTLTAVNLLKHFETYGYNTLWITRTTLKKDLYKAIEMIPLKKTLPIFSYKQFSNICKRKGENYRKLM